MTTKGRVALYVLAVTISACGPATDTSPTPVDPPPPPPPPTVQPIPEVQDRVSVASFAAFKGDQLDQCVDMAATIHAGIDASMPDMGGETPEGMVAISHPCAEQFADRTVWATCTLSGESERGSLVFTEHHYSFSAVYESDAMMRTCLESRGVWQAQPRDTPEWRSARQSQHAQELLRAAERLERNVR
ncbi:MAG: hypothetical protein KBB95_18600 [Deltaproteobacteria bacterium]|nr:hypothetical protein [Deltaproteobacteria bacterium]